MIPHEHWQAQRAQVTHPPALQRHASALSSALAAVAVASCSGRGVTERNEEKRPGCELYGRIFRMAVQYHCMGVRNAAEQPRIAPQLPPNGRMCVWEGEVVEYARNSTIRASSRAGSGPPNWADRPHTARALYSAQRAQCARHPEWPFPKGWPHWLPSPVAGRQSPVRARFGYPRTPRDGYVLVAPEGAPYTDLRHHGWRCAALARHFESTKCRLWPLLAANAPGTPAQTGYAPSRTRRPKACRARSGIPSA